MANFSIDNFKSEVFSRGLAKQNRFEVELPTIAGWEQEGKLASLFCEIASFAPIAIIPRSMRIQGPIYQRGTSVDYGGNISLTFYVDREMLIRRYFEVWTKSIIEPATFNVGYHSDYAKKIVLRQLDDKNLEVYNMTLIDAFPLAIGIQELNHSATSQFHRLTVSFSYRYWESYDIKNDSYYTASISGPTESLTSQEPVIGKSNIQTPITINRTDPTVVFGTNNAGAVTGEKLPR